MISTYPRFLSLAPLQLFKGNCLKDAFSLRYRTCYKSGFSRSNTATKCTARQAILFVPCRLCTTSYSVTGTIGLYYRCMHPASQGNPACTSYSCIYSIYTMILSNCSLVYKAGRQADRQCTYNNEARPGNHCCHGKAMSITYSECVFVA